MWIAPCDRRTWGRRLHRAGRRESRRLHLLGRGSDYGSFRDGSSDGIDDFGATQIFDVEFGYQFNGVTLSLGSNNVFNTFRDRVTIPANLNNGTFIFPGSSPFGYNGRYVYVRSEIILSR